ncbi:MAG TPA: tape measure protein [Anaerolineales bacterium]|nr:tape measure protein [Anaerolineales bacterium]
MQKAGIELIVEGLMAFGRDMESANGSLKKLGSGGTLLQRTFEGIGGALSSFGREVLNVAEVALGVLLRDAINAVITKIKELIGAVFEAGSEFQLLELRLKRLNANWLIENENIKDYSQAMELATQATREQLKWLQQLAFTTPYDASDIANVFTLARSYGFAADEAKSLTESIINFASGMGLGNQEIERIIINFGQLVQQGKLNGQELRDLARGAFVPVNDILTRMRENMGLTTKEFEDMRKGGKLTGEAVQEFISAFQEIVAERFQGAAQDMARSWQGATANVIDFVKSILGLNVVKPILDTLGGALADLLSSISPEDFAFISEHADRFGQSLARLAGEIIGVKDLNLEDLPEKIAKGFDKMTTWINTNGPKIKEFFKDVGKTIKEDIIPWVRDELIPAFQKISDWVTTNGPKIEDVFAGIGTVIKEDIIPWIEEHLVPAFDKIKEWTDQNGPLIKEFFKTLGEIIGGVFEDLKIGGLDSFLASIKTGMQWVIDHKEDLRDWITKFIEFSIWVEKLSFVLKILGIIVGFIVAPFLILGGILLGLIAIIAGVAAVLSLLFIPQVLIALAVLALLLIIYEIATNFEYLKQVILDFLLTTMNKIGEFVANTGEKLGEFVATAGDKFLEFVAATYEKMKEFVANAREKFEEFVANAAEKFEQFKASALQKFEEFKASALQKFEEFKAGVAAKIEEVKKNIKEKIEAAKKAILEIDWYGAGMAIVDGIVAGIKDTMYKVADILRKLANRALEAINHALGIGSPSLEFAIVGEMTILGLVEGIDKNARLAEIAMRKVVARVSAPALNMPNIMQQYAVAASPSVNTSYQTTNNWNLTVHSQARTEQVVQDYNMMQSLGSA